MSITLPRSITITAAKDNSGIMLGLNNEIKMLMLPGQSVTFLVSGGEEQVKQVLPQPDHPYSMPSEPFKPSAVASKKTKLTLTEAAETLGLTKQRTGALLKRGKITGVKKNGIWHVDADSVDRLMHMFRGNA